MLVYEYFEAKGTTLSIECYLPQNPSGKGLVFYYGGGWIEDNRHRFRRFAQDLIKQGITVFLPGYRVYSLHEALPVVCMEDALAGIKCIENLYTKYGVSTEEVSWGGGSAGGQLVLTGAFVNPFCEQIKILPRKIILFNPVCCPHSLKGWIQQQVGREFDFTGLCPLCNMNVIPIHKPRILAMHGTNDIIAPMKDLEKFAEKYREVGGECLVLSYQGRDHGFHHPEISEDDYKGTLETVLSFL